MVLSEYKGNGAIVYAIIVGVLGLANLVMEYGYRLHGSYKGNDFDLNPDSSNDQTEKHYEHQ